MDTTWVKFANTMNRSSAFAVRYGKRLPRPKGEALRHQAETLEDSLAMMKSEKMKCIVQARNTYVVSRLKREKTRHLPEGVKLRVHCVSNQHYAIYKDIVPKEGPILHVNNTGIPALRSHLLGLAAPAIWECHKEILVHKLKVLFHGVHGWTLSAPMEYNRGLPEVVTTAKDLWELVSDTSVERCIQRFSAAVLDKLRAEHASSMADAMRFLAKIRANMPSPSLPSSAEVEGTTLVLSDHVLGTRSSSAGRLTTC